jgi:uncharacterized protein YxjI
MPANHFTQERTMLNQKTYLVRERVGLLKLSDTYDIFDPTTHIQVGIAQEKPSVLVHILRFVINKQMLPTQVVVYQGTDPEDESKRLFSIERGITLLRAKINVCDQAGNVIGYLQSKLMSIGGAFDIFDATGQKIAAIKGDWKGWNFRFLDQTENEIGLISKQWAGIGKELFTSADNYIISFHHTPTAVQATLLLAAGLAVDTVYKEK